MHCTRRVYDARMNNLSFQNYLTKYGDVTSSQKLNIKPRSAAAYRRGERRPKTKDIPTLIKLSEGELCFHSFFVGDDL
ncbi:hypothetical protein [uncultured Mediterranean phage uvMED]|nr:hypothetical protein [uncultured Mediterranean phage uvMED]